MQDMALNVNRRLAFFVLLLVGVLNMKATSRSLHEVPMLEKHEQWMALHGRVYKDAAEKEMRFKIFKANVELIEAFNSETGKSYKLGVNAFTDVTNEEFMSRNGFKVSSHPRTTSFRYANLTKVPPSIDWRQKGAVTPVKNQGQCGSCWAFSAVAATEGVNKLSTSKLISLSEQELVDCATSGENHDRGCQGGSVDGAFNYIIQNEGITTETNYPYEGRDGTCRMTKKSSRAAKIIAYEDMPANNEAALLKAVAMQPVSVGIDASGSSFQFYQVGVYSGECGTQLNHAVTAVGYGTANDGTKYWLVKNSWGKTWGEEGYIRMQRDIDAEEGLCGIAMHASYPTA